MNQTKNLSYNVEHWIEAEDTPRDTEIVSKRVWINDETTQLEVKNIVLNDYEGYEFSHYDPLGLPTTIENGSKIKVYYKKIQIPVIPEEPANPDIPENPIVPEIPLIPEVPEIIMPITPIIPGENNVVRNAVRNPNVTIEDNEIPTDNEEIEEIEDTKVPLDSGKMKSNGAWALINLICVILTVLTGLLALILKHRKEENQEKTEDKLSENDIYVRRRWTKALLLIVSIVSVVIFILTENITLPMVMSDQWTILMIVITLVQIVIYLASTRFKKDDNNEEPKVAYNQ